ncbi:CotO family spore coat protein [Virgibacillus proomii]|uniref:CotO family spore coat protein n=1 Tax=Virgibacillus proomii TaxID=84407 RepID=UPI001C0FD8A7|nr:CotO family spore coat protein [Virgibacillus proomii]MBU5267484.1 spore coat CotO family protein [Virgibacillus proomii]
MGKKYAQKPLLFIHQPKVGELQASMQHMYVTPKLNKEGSSNNEEVVKKGMRHRDFDKSVIKNKQEKLEETEKSDLSHEGKKQSFKDMSIEEKIEYFLNAPNFAPRLKCEVKTSQRTYRGVITGSEGNDVFIRTGNRSTSTRISLEDIKHIKLLGF